MSETKTKHMSDVLEAVKVADAIRHARSPAEIWRALKTFAAPLGFTHLSVLQHPDGDEIRPSIWSDNYISLLPGETRTLIARWRPEDAPGSTPAITVDGWNVKRK